MHEVARKLGDVLMAHKQLRNLETHAEVETDYTKERARERARARERERERELPYRHTIGVDIVGPIQSATLGASDGIRAELGVPVSALVAVGVATHIVDPAPVGVQDDRSVDVLATR